MFLVTFLDVAWLVIMYAVFRFVKNRCPLAPMSGLRTLASTNSDTLIRRLIVLSIRTKRSTKRSFAAVIAAAMIASVLALVAAPVSAKTPTNGTTATSADGRVSGSDRYGTATAAASAYLTRRAPDNALTSWNKIIVVSGDNFPDALSANSLAGAYAAPIILMPSDGTLPTVVKEWALTKRDQIQANSTASASFQIVIVGGTSAVPDAGVDALLAVMNTGDLTPATKTRVSGANRAATAKAVAMTTNAAGSNLILKAADELFLANQNSFADAMAIAPYAFNKAAPVLLTGKDTLGADTLAVLKAYKTLGGTRVKILGGVNAVSNEVVKEIISSTTIPLSSVQRLSGADRYATADVIQNYVDGSSVGAANFDASHVVLVNGSNFADGLAAGPYAGHGTGGAARLMYLTDGTALSSAVAARMTKHAISNGSGVAYPTNVYTVGGLSAVSAAVVSGVTTATTANHLTSTLTCVESAAGTSVTLTVPGNISGTQGTTPASAYYGDEANLILNGSLTINGLSNTSNAGTAMVETYSAVTGNTTLVGLVNAGTLVKGTVITWAGLTELQNAAIGDRAISGSTCTIADDKVGPVPTISAQVGASEFYVTFSEKVTEFDCSDLEMTFAAKVATAYVGCTITSDTAGKVYKVNVFNDMNANNSQDAATSTLGTVAIASATDILTISGNHGLTIGDKVTIDVTAAEDGTYSVITVPSATTLTMSATHSVLGTGTRSELTTQAAGGSILKVAEAPIVIAAADTILVKPQLATAVEVNGVAAVATVGVLGGTFTTLAHTLSVGDVFAYRGAAASANNGSYVVVATTGNTNITVRKSVALTADADVAGQRINDNVVYDVSDNAGSATLTKTMNALNDADVTKPVLSAAITCVQGADAVLSNGTTVKASATASGPQGVNGNSYKMFVVNNRGLTVPTVAVDTTAMTITITADLAYTSISDVQNAYSNGGGAAWTFAHVTGTATAMIGTASATTAATPIKSSGGQTDDAVGAQVCTVKVNSNEVLQDLADNAITATAAVNGVATAFTDGTSVVLAVGWKQITFAGTLSAWTAPIVAGTVTITLSAGPSDAKGNTVTVLQMNG